MLLLFLLIAVGQQNSAARLKQIRSTRTADAPTAEIPANMVALLHAERAGITDRLHDVPCNCAASAPAGEVFHNADAVLRLFLYTLLHMI